MSNPDAFSVDGLLARVRAFRAQKHFGWATLDSLDIGLNPGELAIVAGRTGHGKSTVILNILLHWLETSPDQTFLFFSYEIPPEAVLLKLLSATSRKYGAIGWSYHDVRNWVQENHSETLEQLDQAELDVALRLMHEWQKRLIVVYEPDWPVNKLAAYTRELCERIENLGGIMVDYIQLVTPPPGSYENREHEVAAVARELKRLGVRVDCPVVAAAQIGREAARISDWVPEGTLEDERVIRAIAKRRPQLHHLREGGGEQEADMVMGLLNYRADYLTAVEEAGIDERTRTQIGASGPFDVAILKNRFGRLALASLVFESRTGYLRDAGVFGK